MKLLDCVFFCLLLASVGSEPWNALKEECVEELALDVNYIKHLDESTPLPEDNEKYCGFAECYTKKTGLEDNENLNSTKLKKSLTEQLGKDAEEKIIKIIDGSEFQKIKGITLGQTVVMKHNYFVQKFNHI